MIRVFQTVQLLRAFLGATRGAVSIEYALIASLVSVAILGGVEALSGAVTDLYAYISNEVSSGLNGSAPEGDATGSENES